MQHHLEKIKQISILQWYLLLPASKLEKISDIFEAVLETTSINYI